MIRSDAGDCRSVHLRAVGGAGRVRRGVGRARSRRSTGFGGLAGVRHRAALLAHVGGIALHPATTLHHTVMMVVVIAFTTDLEDAVGILLKLKLEVAIDIDGHVGTILAIDGENDKGGAD